MRLRRYAFKASGVIKDPKQAASIMKDNLNRGPESLVQHMCPEHIILKDKDTVDELDFTMDGDKLLAVKVGVHDWFMKNRKAEIKECFQMAANRASRETGSQIAIDGNMKYEATDENLPEHFYHLTEKKSLEGIMKEGIVPKRGHNDWKSKKKCIYLTEAQYIVPWLGILDNIDEPVVLEVTSDKLPFVEQGRIWEDRNYVPGRIYSEHRTTETIPPEALRVMSPEEVASLGVNEAAVSQLMCVAAQEPDMRNTETGERMRSEEKEVKLCADRLKEMGVMDEKTYADAMAAYDEKTGAADFADFTEQINKIQPTDMDLPFT